MKKAQSTALALNGYAEFLGEVKSRIVSARVSAARAVNQDLVLLYWDIGRGIVERHRMLSWGDSVVEMLARDLKVSFKLPKEYKGKLPSASELRMALLPDMTAAKKAMSKKPKRK